MSNEVYCQIKILSENQVIKVYLYEEGGQRNLEMTIDTKDINKAASGL